MEKKTKFFYKVVYDALHEEIVGEKIAYGELLPSEKEIGERFGVDRTTVRKALSLLVEGGYVEKRAGVGTKVIYRSSDALEMAQKPSKVVGFFMPKTKKITERISQPFYSELFFNLESYLKKQGYSLIYTAIKDEQELADFIEKNRLSGAVFLTAVKNEILNYAKQMHFPSVLVNRYHDDLSCVLGNNSEGGYQAMKALLDHNHTRIAVVTGPMDYITTRERMFGCARAIAEVGMTMDDVVVREADFDFESAVAAVRDIYTNEENKPTAIFAFNDEMALATIRTLREMGLMVPQDVSVIGFDNLEYLSYTEPDLTTIDTQVALMAKVVGYNLLGLIEQHIPAGVQQNVPTRLVLRGTVSTYKEEGGLAKEIKSD